MKQERDKNPNRIVVVPDKDASCSLVESCPVEPIRALVRQHEELGNKMAEAGADGRPAAGGLQHRDQAAVMRAGRGRPVEGLQFRLTPD